MSQEVGWVGLGAMGGALARRVVGAGIPLRVFDRQPDAVTRLETAGALRANNLVELRHCSVVFVCLPSREASESVANEILVGGLSTLKVFVDTSTLLPSVVRELAARAVSCGVSFLDAPVSGDVRSSPEARGVTVMVGGDADAVERVRPILETFAGSIFHLGPVGAGSVAKISNNLISLTSLVTVMEGLLLGVRQGLSAERLSEVIMASSGAMPSVRRIAHQYVSREYRAWGTTRATMAIVIKDLRAAIALAEASGLSVRTAAAALESWMEAEAAGYRECDIYSLLDFLEGR